MITADLLAYCFSFLSLSDNFFLSINSVCKLWKYVLNEKSLSWDINNLLSLDLDQHCRNRLYGSNNINCKFVKTINLDALRHSYEEELPILFPKIFQYQYLNKLILRFDTTVLLH